MTSAEFHNEKFDHTLGSTFSSATKVVMYGAHDLEQEQESIPEIHPAILTPNVTEASVLPMKLMNEIPNLPPADKGFLAWRFLFVIFWVDALFWGPALSFSVLLTYPPYTNMNPAAAASTGIVFTVILPHESRLCVWAHLPAHNGLGPWSIWHAVHFSGYDTSLAYMCCTYITLLSFLQSLAFFVPILYIPSFAKSIGHDGGIYLGIFSGTSIFGQMVVGTLSDYWDVSWLIGITSITSAASILGLWRFCNGLLMLASFTTIYGLTAGGYSCLWQRFVNLIDPEDSNPANLIVIFVTCRGIANIATGPISGTLLSSASSETNGYRILMYYSGALMLLSSFGVVCYFLKKREHKV
ncbi:uncharacterized protein MELLADRAFT_105240 [Melampsora larici-populina 98AG31]|uniref:Major facilitator superfamily (MFS) profile domain-containing protein n=1 Tax=Melampsora larici-populina (strain 98AG31 / pathotype 3-4-7) TaxID=747676 RepID=F4RHB1_MELLP|nr:uncharacterized protein MELLADRAFT_105240 [Melampsora larici-populina 98AG31]EGG08282.1 hypothetical protein MELLADRAFT_105240 [Melampsora larici-populina 98AG31]